MSDNNIVFLLHIRTLKIDPSTIVLPTTVQTLLCSMGSFFHCTQKLLMVVCISFLFVLSGHSLCVVFSFLNSVLLIDRTLYPQERGAR